MTEAISIIVAIAGMIVGLAGWLSGRDKKIAGDAEWRGLINAKLDTIVGISNVVNNLESKVNNHGERITAVEASASQAHKRIDRLEKGG